MSNVIEQGRYTCALGAMQTVAAIPKAVPILHSGPGCGIMVSGFYQNASSYAAGSTTPCSNFTEKEVVFGGIDRLRGVIENTFKVLDTDLQVVLTGCTSGIVGDDVDALADEFRARGKQIVSVETSGFKCTNYEAHSLVVNGIIDQYVDLFAGENESRSEPNTVNLFSSIPYQDPFWKGNLKEYKRLLEGVGLKPHILFGPYSDGVEEWKRIPRANFNILVSPWYGKPIVDNLESKYGQPYTWYPHIPIGANQTEAFLRQTVDFALANGAVIDRDKAEAFIRRENIAYYQEIDSLSTFVLEFRYALPGYAHVLHDSGYVAALSKFLLHEVGIIPKEQFITEKTPNEFKERIAADIKVGVGKRVVPVTFEPDAGLAQAALRNVKHDGRGLIIGSGWDKRLAVEKGCDFLSAAEPSSYRFVMGAAYAGFTGGLRIIEDIYLLVLASFK